MAVLCLLTAWPHGATQDPWREAEENIVRLAPEAFAELPAEITRQLDAGRCLIPQASDAEAERNVVRGEFLLPGQKAWAVLCSVDGVSSIWVFDAENRHVAELVSRPDRGYLQNMGPLGIMYSRIIARVTPDGIRRHYENAGEASDGSVGGLPDLTHDGIENIFMRKASTILYFTGDEWVTLPGAN